jgi:ribosomal protein S11
MYSVLNLCLKLTPNNIILTLQNSNPTLIYSRSSGAECHKGKQKNTAIALKALLRAARKTIKTNAFNGRIRVIWKGSFKWRRLFLSF